MPVTLPIEQDKSRRPMGTVGSRLKRMIAEAREAGGYFTEPSPMERGSTEFWGNPAYQEEMNENLRKYGYGPQMIQDFWEFWQEADETVRPRGYAPGGYGLFPWKVSIEEFERALKRGWLPKRNRKGGREGTPVKETYEAEE